MQSLQLQYRMNPAYRPTGSQRSKYFYYIIWVNVQFTLQDGIVTAARFRHLRGDENYNINVEEDPYKSVVAMYKESLDYLVGKNLKDHLPYLYNPEMIVTTEIDGYTSATIRNNKIISAIRDGLNRGVYSY